jgi:hypothetical protein
MVSEHAEQAGRRGAARPSALAAFAFFFSICLVLIAAFSVNIRFNGIFACSADGYRTDHYLGYCQATAYGDYDHGAVWFNLEPGVVDAARQADVLFIGNSRTQFGFSATAIGRWFSAQDRRHYLLGFSHTEKSTFVAPLLQRIAPKAHAYVINVDEFFVDQLTGPAEEVMRSSDALRRYRGKRAWQRAHRALCTTRPHLCGDALAFYRQRETGEWLLADFGDLRSAPANIETLPADLVRVEAMRPLAESFILGLGVPRRCIVLTYVPQPYTERATAEALAASLGLELISPELEGLTTFDGSHLDRESAERFSAAFIETAAPRLRECLGAAAPTAETSQP